MNFRLEDAGNGETLLTTETRVHATDLSVQKKFASYWRVIYPGSALIRVMWLRADQTPSRNAARLEARKQGRKYVNVGLLLMTIDAQLLQSRNVRHTPHGVYVRHDLLIELLWVGITQRGAHLAGDAAKQLCRAE